LSAYKNEIQGNFLGVFCRIIKRGPELTHEAMYPESKKVNMVAENTAKEQKQRLKAK